MKFNLITLVGSTVIFLAARWAQQTLITGSSVHGRYYVTTLLLVSGILMVITLFRLIRPSSKRLNAEKFSGEKTSDQPRQHYRMQFAHQPHPLFVEQINDRQAGPAFTCAVRNISETGIGLDCAGVYSQGQTVQGEIIFASGRMAPINGVVVRETPDLTSLHLHCTLDPPLLMAEQREQIIQKKAAGPRPAVSRTVLEKRTDGLPSHSPKGVCRIKRP